jgi:Tol biopolymer transport system component
MLQGKLVYSNAALLYVWNFETNLSHEFSGVPLMVSPAWHPQGEWIAFGRKDVYALDTSKQVISPLTTSAHGDGDPSWNPEGSQLVHTRMGANAGLYILDLIQNTHTRIPIDGIQLYHPAWSHNGAHIAFAWADTSIPNIAVIDVDCIGQGQCVPRLLTQELAASYAPAWSPDDKQITFASKRDGYWAIYVMNSDGTNPTRLTNNLEGDVAPVWSPDGDYIAFERWSSHAQRNICVMHPDGSGVKQITTDGGTEPDWWAAPK